MGWSRKRTLQYTQEWLDDDDDDDDILIYFTHNEGKSVIARRFIKALKGNIDKKYQIEVA